MKIIRIAIAIALSLPISLSVIAAALSQKDEPCQAYTVDTPTGYGYEYEEVNNCPLLIRGTFSNANWLVSVRAWEPAAYMYQAVNRSDGSRIGIMDFDVAGTTKRPQYRFTNNDDRTNDDNRFTNEDVTHVVTFQYSDPDTILLQVYQNNRLLVNEVLYRESDRVWLF